MIYKKFKAQIGDIIRISDSLSLQYEKIAEDIGPIWHEIPALGSSENYEDGSYLSVTPDIWFVFENNHWRIMSKAEHIEAERQSYLSPENASGF